MSDPIRPGSSDFAVRVQWPHGIVAGQPAAGQTTMDRQDQVEPIANLGVLALMPGGDIAGRAVSHGKVPAPDGRDESQVGDEQGLHAMGGS